MKKIKLTVIGISYSQTQSGAYALVLGEDGGDRRIPIIIGGFEAQAIAIQLEELNPPRPLTHDLFFNFADTFNIAVKEIIIYKLEEGVFYAKLLCNGPQKEHITIDSRPSDAIALALRFKCPIFTTEDILSKAGIVLDTEKLEQNVDEVDDHKGTEDPTEEKYYALSIAELEQELQKAIHDENYEKASEINEELKKRKHS